jgi:hypothetical protein
LVSLDFLERWRGELHLRERIDPCDDGERVSANGDAGLGELVSEPPR